MSVRLLDRATADGYGTRYQLKGSATAESRIKGILYSPSGSISDGATVQVFVDHGWSNPIGDRFEDT